MLQGDFPWNLDYNLICTEVKICYSYSWDADDTIRAKTAQLEHEGGCPNGTVPTCFVIV